ncbi:PrgI family protein [Patescibacteria group bacterium]|nr:PrgI family protein [Patescibacteria group bacterium]
MQFQVPQFIETEDKIVGPLTLTQFLYVAAGGGVCFILFFFLQTPLWIFFVLLIMPASVSLAFVKINGRSLPVVLLAALGYYWKPRFYIWQREEEAVPTMQLPKIGTGGSTRSLLDSLVDQLKTSKNPIPKREKAIAPAITDRVKSSKERFETLRKITGEAETARRVDYR